MDRDRQDILEESVAAVGEGGTKTSVVERKALSGTVAGPWERVVLVVAVRFSSLKVVCVVVYVC